LVASAAASLAAAALSLSPQSALLDAPLSIRVTGLRPRATVVLTASARSHLGARWRTRVTARAGRRGVVTMPRARLLASLPRRRRRGAATSSRRTSSACG
jgi:hypothetical protein